MLEGEDTVFDISISAVARPIDTVVKERADATLGSALSKVSSSHEAVFVFNEQDEFLGLVSPHRAVYVNRQPYTTKLGSILIAPPKISKDTPLYEVAEYMLALRIYSLPVTDKDGEVSGVINAKDMLKFVTESLKLLHLVSDQIAPRPPVTAPSDATADDVYQLLRRNNSRVLMVDKNNRLAGVVARSDLLRAFMEPSVRRRFPPEGFLQGFYSNAGEKKFREDYPARRFSTSLVFTLPRNTPKTTIVRRLVDSDYNSVVLVDRQYKPVGLVSIRDLLAAAAQLRPEEHEVRLIMKKPDSVQQFELKKSEEFLRRFGDKLKKRATVDRIEITTEELKNPKQLTRSYETRLIVSVLPGEPLVALAKERKFLDSVQKAAGLIEKRRKRTGKTLRHTRPRAA